MNRQDFESVVNTVISPYMDKLETVGNEIEIDLNWDSTYPNASVSLKKGKVIMNFHGAFVKENNLSKDSFAIVVCHEIGHLLGGWPKVFPTQKYSSEAQSDYFATASCIKKYFKQVKNSKPLNYGPIGQAQKDLCNNEESCLRGLIAIVELSSAYPGDKNINSYSSEIANFTNFNDYPSAQCRVDTLRAGLLCEQDECTNGPGKRPACWYNESQVDIPTWEFEDGTEYPEAQIMATAAKVSQRPWGCHVEIEDIAFHGPSYLYPLDEDEIYDIGIDIVGPCVVKEGSDFSGQITKVKDILFRNINSADKSLNL